MESSYQKLLKNPRQSASLISVLFFGWSIPLFKTSYKRVLNSNDAFEPLSDDRSKVLGDRLERYRNDQRLFLSPFRYDIIVISAPRVVLYLQIMAKWAQEKYAPISGAGSYQSIFVWNSRFGNSVLSHGLRGKDNVFDFNWEDFVVFSVNKWIFKVFYKWNANFWCNHWISNANFQLQLFSIHLFITEKMPNKIGTMHWFMEFHCFHWPFAMALLSFTTIFVVIITRCECEWRFLAWFIERLEFSLKNIVHIQYVGLFFLKFRLFGYHRGHWTKQRRGN